MSGAARSARQSVNFPVRIMGPMGRTGRLRVLPARLHIQFLREYHAAAALAARQVGGYRQLHDVLRLWRLTAASQPDPGFADRLAAVRAAVRTGSAEGSRMSCRAGPAAGEL
jgi:hypothetical protein